MKRIARLSILSVLAVALFAGCTSTKPRTLAPTLQDQSAASIDVDEYASKYDGEDGVYLTYRRTVDHATVQGWVAYQTTERRYVVLDPDNETLTTFEIAVDEDQMLKDLDLRVVAPDGATQEFGISDLKTEDSDGTTTYKIAYPQIESGSVVQEVFTVSEMPKSTTSSNMQTYYDVPLQFAMPVEKLEFIFAVPERWEVSVKRTGEERQQLTTLTTNTEIGEKRFTYEATDVPSVGMDEPFSPPFKQMGPYVTLILNKYFSSTFPSWGYLASRYEDFAVDADRFFFRELENTANSLKSDTASAKQQTELVLDWVYENIEVDPSSDADKFDKVIREGRGNPYLVTGLVQAMLDHLDINSKYILVHSAEQGVFDAQFVTAREMQIPALRIKDGGETFFAIPVFKNLPIDVMPSSLQGQMALVLEADGQVLQRLPETVGEGQNRAEADYNLTIREDGTIRVEEERVLRGSRAYVLRRALENLTDEEVDEQLKEELTYTDGDVEWISREVVNQQAFRKPLRLQLAYEIDNLVTVTPEEVLFQTSGLFSPLSGTKQKVDVSERKNPIQISFTQTEVKRIEINYPDAWTLTTGLDDVSFENRFGSVEGTYTSAPGSLTVDQTLTLQRMEDGPDGMKDLLRLIGTQSDLNVPTLVFDTTTEQASAGR